jgi:orotidine-5'-phosphate decarboxylase
MGVTFATIHAYPKAMRAAVAGRGDRPLGLLGVTVLTSMDDADLADAGYGETAADLVARRALDAEAAGMTGVVCSPLEVAALRRTRCITIHYHRLDARRRRSEYSDRGT